MRQSHVCGNGTELILHCSWMRSNTLSLCWHMFMFVFVSEGKSQRNDIYSSMSGIQVITCFSSLVSSLYLHHCLSHGLPSSQFLPVCLSAPLSLPFTRSCCSSKLLNVAAQNYASPSSIRELSLFWNRFCLASRALCHFVLYSSNHLLNGQFVTHSREYALRPVGFLFLIAILVLCVTIYPSSEY